MTRKEAIKFHARRATEALDLALCADSADAAREQFDRAAFHFGRMRGVTAEPAVS